MNKHCSHVSAFGLQGAETLLWERPARLLAESPCMRPCLGSCRSKGCIIELTWLAAAGWRRSGHFWNQ